MASGTTAQVTAALAQAQYSNANSSSMSFSNGTGVTVSNLGNHYTAGISISDAVWNAYTSYMKPKSFKLR